MGMGNFLIKKKIGLGYSSESRSWHRQSKKVSVRYWLEHMPVGGGRGYYGSRPLSRRVLVRTCGAINPTIIVCLAKWLGCSPLSSSPSFVLRIHSVDGIPPCLCF